MKLFILTFLLLQALDFWLTKYILKIGGRELNPVIRSLGLLPSKIISSVLALVVAFVHNFYILPPLIAVVGVACLWNCKGIYFWKLKGGKMT